MTTEHKTIAFYKHRGTYDAMDGTAREYPEHAASWQAKAYTQGYNAGMAPRENKAANFQKMMAAKTEKPKPLVAITIAIPTGIEKWPRGAQHHYVALRRDLMAGTTAARATRLQDSATRLWMRWTSRVQRASYEAAAHV